MSKICFVIMGYGKRTDHYTGKTFELDNTYNDIIKPAVTDSGFTCVRGDEILESGTIDKNMFGLLIHADLVIADITTYNPNAIYELGVRHAARPYSTIVMKEKSGEIPFDINHVKIFTYTHLGETISYEEAIRCQTHLKSLIKSVDTSKEIDSPLFHHIKSISAHKLQKEEYSELIKELSNKENAIFALTERAKNEMEKNNFKEAVIYWQKALEKQSNDPYFIQQYALSTYKSKHPSEVTALNDALLIINRLEPNGYKINDPETLGITGSINKRLWLLVDDIVFLERAIEYYKKGFSINNDYYTGENYALCCDMKANKLPNSDEKIYFKFEANKTRKIIKENLIFLISLPESSGRVDLKWMYATLSHCCFALGENDEYTKFETLFVEQKPIEWELYTYNESLAFLTKLLF